MGHGDGAMRCHPCHGMRGYRLPRLTGLDVYSDVRRRCLPLRIRCQASLDGNDWVKQDGRAGGHEAPGWGWRETEPASNEECWAAGEQGRAGQASTCWGSSRPCSWSRACVSGANGEKRSALRKSREVHQRGQIQRGRLRRHARKPLWPESKLEGLLRTHKGGGRHERESREAK